MLKKLKYNIILVNVLSLALVILMMLTAVYFILYNILVRQEDTLLLKVAAEEDYNIRFWDPDVNPENPNAANSAGGIDAADMQKFSLFYVIKNKEGEIADISPNNFDDVKHIISLVDKVDRGRFMQGKIDVNDVRLSYRVEYKGFGKIYIFIDRSFREDILATYLTISLVCFFLTTAAVFAVSMFISEKAIQPVRLSMEEQKKFVADASHELRTPLAVIRSNIELIMDSPDSKVSENEKWLGYVLQEILRMTSMTENMLLLEKYDGGKSEYPRELFSLSEYLDEISGSFLPLIHSYGLRFEKHIQKDIYFSASKEKIKQLVTIFIDNAVKYTKEGAISLSLEQTGGKIFLSVKDTGIGIKEEDKYKIFERFYRVDKSRSRSSGGSGLGLSIAKTIVDEYKGKIEVKSELASGSAFTVIFECDVGASGGKREPYFALK